MTKFSYYSHHHQQTFVLCRLFLRNRLVLKKLIYVCLSAVRKYKTNLFSSFSFGALLPFFKSIKHDSKFTWQVRKAGKEWGEVRREGA